MPFPSRMKAVGRTLNRFNPIAILHGKFRQKTVTKTKPVVPAGFNDQLKQAVEAHGRNANASPVKKRPAPAVDRIDEQIPGDVFDSTGLAVSVRELPDNAPATNVAQSVEGSRPAPDVDTKRLYNSADLGTKVDEILLLFSKEKSQS